MTGLRIRSSGVFILQHYGAPCWRPFVGQEISKVIKKMLASRLGTPLGSLASYGLASGASSSQRVVNRTVGVMTISCYDRAADISDELCDVHGGPEDFSLITPC